ncbi:unnamed protein product [Larinioides sclopetarius]|uniref:Uncharacterized protein n=1 Tax=Larinioides sclopetarius TaxID=280406 RepID=A0AAV2AJK4_9ARAC
MARKCGILNGFTFSRQYRGSKGKISWLSIPLRTFTKFTPMEMIVVGFFTTLFSYMGSGSLWPKYDTNPVCKKYWIWNLFYLSNFLSHEKQCIIQIWHLACLMQLQLFSPLLLIPLIKKPKIGYYLTAFVIVSSCLASFALLVKYNLVESLMIMNNVNSDLQTFGDK